jgi:hypothetical protein
MPWILVGLSLAGMVVAFITTSPGILALALLVTVVSMFCAIFAFAARRIAANAQPDSALLTPDVLAHIREKARREQAARSAASQAQAPRAIPRDPPPPQKFT